MLYSLIYLQFKLWSRGDRLLYFYLGCVSGFIFFYLYSIEFLWITALALSNIYLVLLYTYDKALHTFYNVLHIDEFKLHLAKVIGVYLLSLIEIIFLMVLVKKDNYTIDLIAHFLTFFTALLLFRFPNWLKILTFIMVLKGINYIVSITKIYLALVIVLLPVSLCLIIIYNERKSF